MKKKRNKKKKIEKKIRIEKKIKIKEETKRCKFANDWTRSKVRVYRLAVPGHRFEPFLITWPRNRVTWFASSSIKSNLGCIDRAIMSKLLDGPWPINAIANYVRRTVNFESQGSLLQRQSWIHKGWNRYCWRLGGKVPFKS